VWALSTSRLIQIVHIPPGIEVQSYVRHLSVVVLSRGGINVKKVNNSLLIDAPDYKYFVTDHPTLELKIVRKMTSKFV